MMIITQRARRMIAKADGVWVRVYAHVDRRGVLRIDSEYRTGRAGIIYHPSELTMRLALSRIGGATDPHYTEGPPIIDAETEALVLDYRRQTWMLRMGLPAATPWPDRWPTDRAGFEALQAQAESARGV